MGIGYQKAKYEREKAEKAAALAAPAPIVEIEAPPVLEAAPTETAPVAAPPAVDPTMATVMAQFAAILQELRAANTPAQKDAAISQAEILQQILVKTRPENVAPPLQSIYNPFGERDHPKPALKCKVYWVGFDLKTDTLTPEEVELLNRLEPVECQVTKADGAKIPFKVTATRGGDLTIERLEVSFPCKGQDKHNHGSMLSYLQQALGDRRPTVEELMVELAREKAKHLTAA